MTTTDLTRMSHRDDPHTSEDAAEKVLPNVALLRGAILYILTDEPLTPGEVNGWYESYREDIAWFPEADLYGIRKRMSELQRDGRIEPIEVGTNRNGRPQYMTRRGQRVMRLAVSS